MRGNERDGFEVTFASVPDVENEWAFGDLQRVGEHLIVFREQ
jgi:hypothetical protein